MSYKSKSGFYISAVLLFIVAVAIKVLYINTAESSYNAEELPLAAMSLAASQSTLADIAVTRLYGTLNITSAISMAALGFNVWGVKLPNIIFFFATIYFLTAFSLNYFKFSHKCFALFPAALLCLGPPVIQIWGMKNRGGFIENIFALTLCLWICSRSDKKSVSDFEKFAIAIIIGLATWSQPMGVIWGACFFVYFFGKDVFQNDPKVIIKSVLTQIAGFVLGILPLIALNFLFDFRTINFIEAGEAIGGVDLGHMGRFQQLVLDGVPRLLGLKEQWHSNWILPMPLSLMMYTLFLAPVVIGCWNIVVRSFRYREINIGLLVISVGGAILLANVLSSWGNFQLEPRRLLLLYVPLAILISYGLKDSKKLLWIYIVAWVGFNIFSNYTYISRNINGFSSVVYRSMKDVAVFLEEEKVSGVYTDIWTGGRITFETGGRVPWFRSIYQVTSYGYVGDDKVAYNEAMVFDVETRAGVLSKERFLKDLSGSDISCRSKEISGVYVVYKCSRDFRFSDIGFAPSVKGGIAFEGDASGDDIKVLAGKKVGEKIVADGSAGYLIYGPYAKLLAGRYEVLISGAGSSGFVMDIVSDQGEREYFKHQQSGALGNGILLRQEFSLPNPVMDFEVRVHVPAESDLEISGYKIIKK